MSLSKIVKEAGFRSVGDLASHLGLDAQTMQNWNRSKRLRPLLKVIIVGVKVERTMGADIDKLETVLRLYNTIKSLEISGTRGDSNVSTKS